MPEEPESSQVLFEGPVVTLVRERWVGIDHPYDVARHVGAVGVLALTPGEDVLLVRQFRPPVRRALDEIPAGLLDVRGEDARACASRELFEETGYRARWLEPLGAVFSTPGFSDERVQLFWAGAEPEPAGKPEAGIELVRRPLAEMVREARAGRIADAKTALALLMVDGRPRPA